MKFISWNVRGLKAPNKRHLINSQLDLVKWDIGLFQETKLSLQNLDLVFSSWKKWKFFSCLAAGASGGLALLWNDFVVDVKMVASEPNWMLSLVSHRASSFKVWVFNIYAPLGILAKYDLWQVLIRASSPLRDHSFVILGGDFNDILDVSKKSGGIIPNKKSIEDFNAFISDMSLFYCKPNNGLFKLTNMRKNFSQIAEHLDKFLLSSNWFDSDIESFSSILPLSGSNHFPVLLTVVRDRSSFKFPFKFEPMWFRDTSFLPLLCQWWGEAPFLRGSRMFQLVKKISFLKKNIRSWNSLHFKNIFEEK